MAIEASQEILAARRFLAAGDLPAAERALRGALDREPGQAEALLTLGILYARTDRLDEAIACLEAAVRAEPDRYEGLVWLAIAKRLSGDPAAAIESFQRAIRLRSDDPAAYLELGLCWLGLREPRPAIDAFTKAIRLEPKAAPAYFHLGTALKLNGASMEAFHAFKRAAELDPDFLPSYVEIFKQTQQLLNWKDGLARLEEGHRRHPQSTLTSIALAVTYGKLQRGEEAESLFRTAAARDPMARPPYAHWLHEEGRFEEAERLLVEAIRLDPTLGEAYHNLAVAKTFEIDGTPLAELARQALARDDLRPEARMYLHYALAKSSEHRRDYGAAMSYYDRANAEAYAIYNSRVRFDPQASNAFLERTRKAYSREAVRRLSRHGSPSETPIFVVGMIRSGTTLLDQILASHPAVRSAGELPFWGLNAPRLEYKWQRDGVDPRDVSVFAQKYLEALEEAGGRAARISDKMPVNYHSLGLIHAVFPNARIVHIRREPMDTAISIYTTYLGDATSFAYDQGNIVGTYREYLRLMEHWRAVLPPDRFYELDYERLVTDSEPVLRDLIAFCGLEWDDACLSPEVNPGRVSTPSLFTARQPINAGSVGRWQRYEPWLGQLLELRDAHHPPSRNG